MGEFDQVEDEEGNDGVPGPTRPEDYSSSEDEDGSDHYYEFRDVVRGTLVKNRESTLRQY